MSEKQVLSPSLIRFLFIVIPEAEGDGKKQLLRELVFRIRLELTPNF